MVTVTLWSPAPRASHALIVPITGTTTPAPLSVTSHSVSEARTPDFAPVRRPGALHRLDVVDVELAELVAQLPPEALGVLGVGVRIRLEDHAQLHGPDGPPEDRDRPEASAPAQRGVRCAGPGDCSSGRLST